MRTLALLLAGALSAAQLYGQGAFQEERLLLPLLVEPTPGNHGSLWVSELWFYNDSGTNVSIFPLPAGDLFFPPRVSMRLCCTAGDAITARAAGRQPGKFIWVLSSRAAGLHFNLRVQDTSRQAQTWGTEIPVVREAELRTDRISLLNIPIHERFRQMLRIYQALSTGDTPGEVRIRFFRMNNGALPPGVAPFREEVATLAPDGVPVEYSPGYAQLSDFNVPPGVSSVRIEIEPVTPGIKYWAFVSVINNETQHLTIVTPQ